MINQIYANLSAAGMSTISGKPGVTAASPNGRRNRIKQAYLPSAGTPSRRTLGVSGTPDADAHITVNQDRSEVLPLLYHPATPSARL